MANLRNHIVIIATVEAYSEGSVSGSGPSYTVSYDSDQDISSSGYGPGSYWYKKLLHEIGQGLGWIHSRGNIALEYPC